MNIKDILNNVLAQSGFLERASFFNSQDPDDKQMCAIANRAQQEIRNFYNWGELRIPHTITMVSGQSLYPMPIGFLSLVPDSVWETDGSRKVDIPASNNMWYKFKFSSLTTGGTIRGKFYGDNIELIDPVPGESISFEYVTEYAVRGQNAQPKELFNNDFDTWLLDDQLLILGIQAHWMMTKLMPQYQEMMVNYFKKTNESIARSAQSQTIGGSHQQSQRAPYTKLWVSNG